MNLDMVQYVRCSRTSDALYRALAEIGMAELHAFLELRDDPTTDRAMHDELAALHVQLSERAHHFRALAQRHLKALSTHCCPATQPRSKGNTRAADGRGMTSALHQEMRGGYTACGRLSSVNALASTEDAVSCLECRKAMPPTSERQSGTLYPIMADTLLGLIEDRKWVEAHAFVQDLHPERRKRKA